VLQLWKGLFFALWMADRAIPQQNLAAELAGLTAVLPERAVAPWLRGFWATMAREWTGIDVLRMNKFLLLVRRVLGASLAWMKDPEDGWDAGHVDAVLSLLAGWPFLPQEQVERAEGEDGETMPKVVPVGLRVHVLDTWVDEAEKVGLLNADDEAAKEILKRLNGLVEALAKATTAPAVRVRAKEALDDERLPWNASAGGLEGDAEDADVADDASWDGFND
jgi:ribosomal RNA-processing protein 1